MWNKAKIMRMAERTLKRTEAYRESRTDSNDPEDNFQVDYVLVKGSYSVPEKAISYAHCMDQVISFDPLDCSTEPKCVWEWADSFDRNLFSYLEKSYTLAGMSLVSHYAAWCEIAECYSSGGIEAAKGMQKYLSYCKRNGVNMELLRRELQYDGMDVMTFFDRSAIQKEPDKGQER